MYNLITPHNSRVTKFQHQGYDIIKNLLDPKEANMLHQFYMDYNDWDIYLFPDEFPAPDKNPEYPLAIVKKEDKNYAEKKLYAQKTHLHNFSYHYSRTNYLHPILVTHFQSDEFIKELEIATGKTDLKLGVNFVNCLESGDWNGPHHDGIQGRVAFIYHLTKDWRPQDGGLFFRTDKNNWEKILSVTMPTFNQYVVMDVEGYDTGAPHFVSHIAPEVTNKRISYIGWYQ